MGLKNPAAGIKFHDRLTHDGAGTTIPFIAMTQDGQWIGNMEIDYYQTSGVSPSSAEVTSVSNKILRSLAEM